MQLVLLSGGSGKRLWPLSNNVRSKQFLPLFESENGTMESMIQRVIRQVQEASLTTDITIAINAAQLDIVSNQLGDTISVVTEPERRDTFPAIALAASYLSLEKDCSNDEVVVIMPCDPYTENSYFETIACMVECVQHDVAELVLMGVTPTYPSEKYGYVVPQEAANNESRAMCLPVARFTEKPTTAVAEELLKQNAFWNGGVFAFRLGYMMNIVHKYIASDSFDDIRARYNELPKISFDYEVVEKAKSVAVVPFNGQWKDLGTWNILTDELKKTVLGNAVMGCHCENTHIINELKNPIYVDGLKDVVVAACPDGILVCGKEYAEDIKKTVENFTLRPMYEEKRWGTYRILDETIYADGNHVLTASVTIKAGKSICYQKHNNCAETLTFIHGEGIFILDGVEQLVKAGDTIHIPVEHCYVIKAVTELTFIEVRCCNQLIDENIERFGCNS